MAQAEAHTQRFPIQFDPAYRLLSSTLLLLPSDSYVEIGERELYVRMGWAFRLRCARGAVARIEPSTRRPLSRGVHGFAGRWLVNGSGSGIISLHLLPAQRGYVMGVPVRVRELMLSVEDVDALSRALG
jgi:hypothetical protein